MKCINRKKALFFFVDFLIVFSSTFIADKTVFGVTISAIILPLVLMRRKKFDNNEILVTSISIFLFPIFLSGVAQVIDIEYYNFYIQTIFYIPVLFFIIEIFEEYDSNDAFYALLLLLLFFSVGTILHSVSTGGRGRIIFGPNMIYRVLSFIWAFYYIFLLREASGKKINLTTPSIIMLLIFFLGMLSTGSRGGLVTLLIYLSVLIISIRISPLIILAFSLSVLFGVCFIIDYWHIFGGIINRLIFFDLSNNSEAYRFSNYTLLSKFLNDSDSYQILFGLTSENSLLSFYPHNIILELIFYCGLISVIIFMLGFVLIFKNYNLYKYIIFLFLGVGFGSLVSGNMQYNFPILSLSLLGFSTIYLRKI